MKHQLKLHLMINLLMMKTRHRQKVQLNKDHDILELYVMDAVDQYMDVVSNVSLAQIMIYVENARVKDSIQITTCMSLINHAKLGNRDVGGPPIIH